MITSLAYIWSKPGNVRSTVKPTTSPAANAAAAGTDVVWVKVAVALAELLDKMLMPARSSLVLSIVTTPAAMVTALLTFRSKI